MTGLSALLAAFVSPWFLLLTGFVALNQLLFASVRHCGASLILEHVFGAQAVRPVMSALGPIGRLGRFAATHRRGVFVAWVVIAVGLGFLAPRVETALSGAGWQANGSDSVKVREQLDTQLRRRRLLRDAGRRPLRTS